MSVWELLLTALALSMDAMAAAAATGALMDKVTLDKAMRVGAWFGLFQAFMPVVGLMGGQCLAQALTSLGHWAAFGLLAFTGGRMILEDLKPGEGLPAGGDPLATGRLLTLAVATSLDALAVGISLAVSGGYKPYHGLVIGLVTFSLCTPAVLLGERLRHLLHRRAGVAGGTVLILIGVKILAEYLMRGN